VKDCSKLKRSAKTGTRPTVLQKLRASAFHITERRRKKNKEKKRGSGARGM